ncbi:MAG: hypothetical protein OXI96_07870 [Acidimicrobiaceae bacterium]|nr:hypothetical protein [Acidimicrobiaceae bacterium]
MSLQKAAKEFADKLNNLVDSTIHTNMQFVIDTTGSNDHMIVHTARSGTPRFKELPLIREDEDPNVPALLLHVKFIVEMDDENTRLRVERSTISLWVDITRGRKKPRPLVRVEYDRRRNTKDGAAAHVHLHANSPEMAWIYGSSGQPAPDLYSLHFPVGGQQFRPTFEDFLLFLEREKLYTNFKQGWKTAVLASLQEWKHAQAASTVRHYPHTAAETLTRLGYL